MVACGTWAATEAPQVQGRTSGPIVACSSKFKYTVWTEKLNLQGCRNLKGTCLAEVHYSRTLADTFGMNKSQRLPNLALLVQHALPLPCTALTPIYPCQELLSRLR